MIDLYYWPTPNGWKITIMLEECGLPYTIRPVNIGRGDQLSSTFLRISPNGRMPAIVDHEPVAGGGPITIFESGAIMMYLGEKTRKFWPQEPHLKYEVCQWILWQQVIRDRNSVNRDSSAVRRRSPSTAICHFPYYASTMRCIVSTGY
jgi:GST-like protein